MIVIENKIIFFFCLIRFFNVLLLVELTKLGCKTG